MSARREKEKGSNEIERWKHPRLALHNNPSSYSESQEVASGLWKP
jgi:hypothetical protein